MSVERGRWSTRKTIPANALAVPIEAPFFPDWWRVGLPTALAAPGIRVIAGVKNRGISEVLTGSSQWGFPTDPDETDRAILIDNLTGAAVEISVYASRGYPPDAFTPPVTVATVVTPSEFQTLTDAANIAWDLVGGSARVTLGGNRTLNNPTNPTAGGMYFLLVKQDATGNRKLTWGSGFRFEGGVTPTLSFLGSQEDLFEFMADDGGLMICQRMTRNVAATWSPLNISQLKLWYDASQIAGLLDGDPVATWPDMSGNSFDATQGVAASRPLYKIGIVNGLPTVRFDGTNDYLSEAGYSIPLPCTFFVVGAALGGAGILRTLFGSTSAAIELRASATNTWDYAYTAVAAIVNGAVVLSQYRLLEVSLAAAYEEFWINGASIGSAAVAPLAPALARLGANQTPARYLNGDLAEVIVYASQLSTAQRQQVEAYLRAKYNLW